jgi:hypothetical protein
MSRLDPSASPRGNLRGAWWILVVVVLFFAAVAVRQLGLVAANRGEPRVGDGEDPSTYGYDLAALTIDTRWLAATMPKDALDALDAPPLLRPAQVDSLNGAERGKYLVPDDRVVGVVVDGVARAYPVRVMDWHEVANDTLGGEPVLVTWHPLSGTAAVFARRVAGRVREFSITGLVWNSHHVLHDGGADGAESLWVPLLGRAVGGPLAGAELEPIPCALTTWGAWRAAHPATTVPAPASDMKPAYKRDPYGNYASGDVIRYPVTQLPPLPEDQRLKDTLAVAPATRDGVTFARLHGYRFALQAVGLR